MQTMLYQMPKIQGKRKKYLNLFNCFSLTFFFFVANAQNTNYTPLYTSGTFVKTIDFTKPVGEIEGNVSATGSGGVSYSVPIFTSPGTNGVQPSIGLVYNSQGSSGVAGFGWNISGLSAISRAGKNIYHNGIVKPVSYTSDDAFLLDGMRLNAITGANGANGTIYAGETETFAKIISTTLFSADNPDWFQVTAKDGAVMEFGNSADSRITTDNAQSVMLWRLNKIIDVNGNYVEFKYDNSNRDSRIQQILYTGNSNAGLLPYNQVNFTYSIRADQNTGYEGGASLSSQYLLDKITIVHTNDAGSNETVKTYRLNYGFDNVHSMLKELIEFGGDETAASLNSTIFLYGDPTENTLVETTPQFTGECITGDFNADGKTDILASTSYYDNNIKFSTGYKIFLNPQSSVYLYEKTFPAGHIVVENKKLANFLTSDYNRDGVDDVLSIKTVLVTYPSGYTERKVDKFTIDYTTATGSTTAIMPMQPEKVIHPSGNFFLPGDFDGDGNQDYLTILASPSGSGVPSVYYGYITTPGGTVFGNYGINGFTVTPGVDWSANSIAAADKILPFDLNGDGKQEVLVVKGNQTSILSLSADNNGITFTASIILTTTEIASGDRLFPGDFNGDRKSDLLIKKTNGQWKILYSTGIGFNISNFNFNQTVILNGDNTDHKIIVGDFNGDGKSDILHGYNYGTGNNSKLSMYYSKGINSSFFYEQYDYNTSLPFNDVVPGDFNGDGRTDILLKGHISLPADIIYFKPYSQERILQKITTGHNVTTTFIHKLMTDKRIFPVVHNRTISLSDPINKYPFNYIELPIYLLATLSYPDGAGGDNISYYKYENAVLHRAAKGFLGFKKIIIQNNISDTRSVTENEINTQFAVPYTVRQTTNLYSTNQQLSESLIFNSFQNLSTANSDIRYFQKIDKTLGIDYLNGKAAETVNTYDSYGNVVNSVSKAGVLSGNTVTPTETSLTAATYSFHNTPVPAKPDDITVTNTRVGMPSITTTTLFTYTLFGLPASQTNFNGLPKAVTTSFSYNNLGNLISTIINTAGLNNRISNFTYDAKGRFVLQKQIASGTSIAQSESFTYDTKWGNPLSSTTSDCLTVNYQYDAFGDIKQTTLPDGNIATVNAYWHTSNFGVNISAYKLFYTLVHYTGGKPDTKKYIDKFGREWQNQTATLYKPLQFDEFPDFHTIQTSYDKRGNVKTKTNSFFPFSETARLTTNDYDEYNRLVSSSNDLGTATVAYLQNGSGNMGTIMTSPYSQVSSKITDPAGRVISSTDNGGTLSFSYDSHGNQLSVNHSGTVVISSIYDIYDKQTSLTDKDAGLTSYTYNGYGQLTQQTDANGNTYNMQYDDLGRNTVRTGPEGTTTYEYYKDAATGCSNNNLKKVTGFNGVIKEYTYDALKRLSSQKETIDAIDYTTSYYYNPYSQIAYTSYPSGMIIRNEYDVNSYLIKVFYKQNIFFANGTVDGEGRYKTYTSVNGLTTTNTFNKDFPATTSTPGVQSLTYNFQLNTGNLLQRTDNIKNQNELFTYDNLNRLTASTVNGTQQFGITYDGSTGSTTMGNITSKTDAGYYKYRNDKIHAVAYTMETPVPGQAPVFPAPVSATPQNEQLITYTPFLKTATITETTLMLEQYALAYTYGPDYQRVKSELSQGRFGIVETKIYLGNYEKQIKNGVTREIHYVNGPNGLCGMVVSEGGIHSFYATYTDYLGSITTITSNTATIVAEQNFDAWGRQRNPNNWNDYTTIPNPPVWLYRGYTGHEMVTLFSLINMNGRMYDPVLGRMLSPDNYVSAPYGTQGYNRYTYAMNNPLKFTDPDGNFVHLIVGAIIGAVVNLASSALHGNIHSWGDGFKAFGIGALQGAVGAAIGYGGFGWNACGRAATAGLFTNAGFYGSIATGIASSFMPAIPFGDNFSISPSFAFGSHGLSSGLSANYRKGNFSLGIGFSNGGNNRRFSYGGGWDDGNTGFSYMHNKFYGQYSQTTGTIGFHADRINGSWENDRFAASHDRWRTNGMGLGYSFKNGSRAFIGSRFMTGQDDGGKYDIFNQTYNEIEGANAPREGLFYASFYNRNGIGSSVGVDWEHGMHQVQNGMHDLLRNNGVSNDWYFPSLGRPIGGFYRYGNSNPFTYFH